MCVCESMEGEPRKAPVIAREREQKGREVGACELALASFSLCGSDGLALSVCPLTCISPSFAMSGPGPQLPTPCCVGVCLCLCLCLCACACVRVRAGNATDSKTKEALVPPMAAEPPATSSPVLTAVSVRLGLVVVHSLPLPHRARIHTRTQTQIRFCFRL